MLAVIELLLFSAFCFEDFDGSLNKLKPAELVVNGNDPESGCTIGDMPKAFANPGCYIYSC